MTDDYGNEVYVTPRELHRVLDQAWDALDSKIERVEGVAYATREEVAVVGYKVDAVLARIEARDRADAEAAEAAASADAQRDAAWIGMVGACLAALISTASMIATLIIG